VSFFLKKAVSLGFAAWLVQESVPKNLVSVGAVVATATGIAAAGITTSVSTSITALAATTTATVTWFILFLGQLSCKCLCIHKLRLLDKLSARDVGLSLLVG